MRSAVTMLTVACGLAIVGSAGIVGAQTAPAPKLNYAAMNKLGWKLSSQAWTFNSKTLFETIETLNKLGIRYIEMFPGQKISADIPAGFDQNVSQENLDKVLAQCKKFNVTPVAFGVTGVPGDEAGARKLFEFGKKLGLLNIVCEPDENAMPMLDKLATEFKINVAIHNHPNPSHYWNPDTVLKVCAGLSNRVGSCSDTGHWPRSGLVPMDCLKKLKGRIIEFHFKDLDATNGDNPWGTGVNDAAGMLKEIKAQGFKGVFSIEYERTGGQELYDNVSKCVVWFSEQATKLAKGK